jgi:hypothetical protein
MSAGAGTLDEAYERLHVTGPEFDGFLSNHGPMAAEAMVRHGHSGVVGSWLDGYMRRRSARVQRTPLNDKHENRGRVATVRSEEKNLKSFS